MPLAGADLNHYEDEKDFIVRAPLRKLWSRSGYTQNPDEKVKLRWKGRKGEEVSRKIVRYLAGRHSGFCPMIFLEQGRFFCRSC